MNSKSVGILIGAIVLVGVVVFGYLFLTGRTDSNQDETADQSPGDFYSESPVAGSSFWGHLTMNSKAGRPGLITADNAESAKGLIMSADSYVTGHLGDWKQDMIIELKPETDMYYEFLLTAPSGINWQGNPARVRVFKSSFVKFIPSFAENDWINVSGKAGGVQLVDKSISKEQFRKVVEYWTYHLIRDPAQSIELSENEKEIIYSVKTNSTVYNTGYAYIPEDVPKDWIVRKFIFDKASGNVFQEVSK